MTFPKEYPHMPPKMQFITEIYHPNGLFGFVLNGISNLFFFTTVQLWLNSYTKKNLCYYYSSIFDADHIMSSVFKSGEICISILHPPGEDRFGHEDASERWLPIHTVTTIALSVISMLSDPNDRSPANIDAAVRGFICFVRRRLLRL
jgi:ubiquitin-conjugating enzyme E2 G1